MTSRWALPVFIVALVLGGILIAKSIPIAHWWANQKVDAPGKQMELGKISSFDGRVLIRNFKQTEFNELSSPTSVLHLDTLQIQSRSRMELEFPSNFKVAISGPALLVLEAWQSTSPQSPVLLHVLSGELEILTEGTKGQLYVMKDNQMLDPVAAAKTGTRGLILSSLNLVDSNSEPTAPEAPPQPKANEVHPDSVSVENTLSNEYIDANIAERQEDFQRCQTHAVRENAESRGQILIGITIAPTGKMDEVRILSSDINNETFKNCVVEVFQRIHFKAFSGPVIVRSYPLKFE